MQNKSEAQSFRRKKLIEEMAPQKRAEALANSQNTELSNIAGHLQDAQAASEITADVVETKSNEIITTIQSSNKKLDDITAGIELTAEIAEKSSGEIKQLTGTASIISDKLSKLSSMLSERFTSDATRVPSQTESNALQVINDSLPLPVEDPRLEDLIEQLVPGQALPPPEDADFLPPVQNSPQEETESKNESKTSTAGINDKLDSLLKVTKTGFKSAVSVTDKIAGMLFKYTITAAAQAAKFAAMLFAVVLGIDSVKVYFEYFMKQFESSWEQFSKKFEEWGPLISSLMTMAKNVSAMFEEKNWLGIAKAIINGMTDLTLNMANLLMLGMAKLTAAMLRSMGFNDSATTVEGGALQTFQQNTGAKLDDKDSTTLAKYQDMKDKEQFEAKNKEYTRFNHSPSGLNVAQQYGSVSKETADEIRSGKIDSSFRDLPEEERLNIFKKRNEAQAAIIRLTETADSLMKPDETDKKNAKESYDAIKAKLSDPALKMAPKDLNLEQLIAKMDKSLEKFNNQEAPLKPQPVQEREEVQQIKRVDEAVRQKEAERSSQGSQQLGGIVQQINVQKNNKTQYNIPPQSSTPAPGMNNATRVN